MKEIILIGAVMAMFVFGFYIMDKVDHFLNDNYSRLEVMEHTSALRIAMEDSFIAASSGNSKGRILVCTYYVEAQFFKYIRN